MLFVSKNAKLFSLKKGFSTKLVYQLGFFNYLIKIRTSFFRIQCRMTFRSYITVEMKYRGFCRKPFSLLLFALLICLLDLKCQRSMTYKYKVYHLRGR